MVDLMYRDTGGAFAVTFIPDDDASGETTEFMQIEPGAPEYSRIASFFECIEQLIAGESRQIVRVVHQGGGDYAFHVSDGTVMEMADQPCGATTHEASDRLKQIAESAEAAFRAAHATRR